MNLINAAQQWGAVQVVPGQQSGKFPDGNQVLVKGGDTFVAFDTPLVARHLLPTLQQVDLVLLSHAHEDHMVALGAMAQAAVQVHAADLEAVQSWEGFKRHYGYPEPAMEQVRQLIVSDFSYQARPDASGFEDGQLWDLGAGVRVRAHHLPGHTSGHCALVVESEGVAFIGDIDLTGFGPYYGDATSDMQQFMRSLQRVREIDARVWVTSHHRGTITERAEFERQLARFAAHIEQRHDKLLGYLKDGPQTLEQLATRRLLYPAHATLPFVESAERRSIAQHLEWLQAQCLVEQGEGGAFYFQK